MNRWLCTALLLVSTGVPAAEPAVSIPWEEFRELYRGSVEREIMKGLPRPPRKETPQVHSIEEAAYRICIGKVNTDGDVLISGRVISGDPAPIPLFGPGLIITATDRVTGGVLLSGTREDPETRFLPDGSTNTFQIALSFCAQLHEDNRSHFLSLSIPAALRNSLNVSLPPDRILEHATGIPDAEGVYRFSASTTLDLRVSDREGVSAATPVKVDTFSQIQIQDGRAELVTTFAPVQSLPDTLVVHVQEGARYVTSSLKSSWISRRNASAYQVELPAGETAPFFIQFSIDRPEAGSDVELVLPSIENNKGREGDFIVEEPDDARITADGTGMVSGIPADRLHGALAGAIGLQRTCMHIPRGEILRLNVEQFTTVSRPAIVLNTQQFFVSFEENGGVLSTLVMDIPPNVGPRLTLNAVPDTEVWSLTVNEHKREVYGANDGTWIIPLDPGQTSHIQLSLLSTGAKLGLQGRLEVALPATGLPAEAVRVGIALPKRVRLLSLEGPVSPDRGGGLEGPPGFAGQPYFFSRSFYKGEGMKLAASYREPVTGE